jgi:phosphate/sulfate permease
VNRVRAVVDFWYDFVVGDDAAVAIGVLALLVVCAVLAHSPALSISWLVMTLGVALVLGVSLWRAVRLAR